MKKLSKKLSYEDVKKMYKEQVDQQLDLIVSVQKEKKDYWQIEDSVHCLHQSVSILDNAITLLKKVDLELTEKFSDIHLSNLESIKLLINREWKNLSEKYQL